MNFFQVVYINQRKCIFWRSKSTTSIMDFPLQGVFVFIIQSIMIRLFEVVTACFLLSGSIPKRIMIIIMMNFFQIVYIKLCKCIFWRSKSTTSIMDFPLQGVFVIIIQTITRLFEVAAACFYLPGSIPKRIMTIIMMNFFQIVYIKLCKCIFWRSNSTSSIMDFPLQDVFVNIIQTIRRLFEVAAAWFFYLPGSIPKRIILFI